MNPALVDKLKRVSVTIRCTTELRRTLATTWSNIGRMGRKPTPEQPLLEALQELGRLAAYFGVDDQARKALAAGTQHGYAARLADERARMSPAARKRLDRIAAAYHGGEGDPD